MADMLKEFERLIDTDDVSSVDRLDLPARAERSTSIPDAYIIGPLADKRR